MQQQQLNDPEDEEDSDDDGQIVPPHLRNMEDAPKPPEGALHPSLGSEGHDEGTCKRCCFFPRGRCTNGYNCEFCHYEHDKRKRKNKKKKKKEAVAIATGTAAVPVPCVGSLQQMQPPPVILGPPAPVVHMTQPSSPVLQQAALSTVPPAAPALGQYLAYPPSPDRSSQHQQLQQLQQQPQPILAPSHGYQMHPQAPLGAGAPPPQIAQQQMPLPQPAPHHHVIYGPTHVPTSGTQPQALQGFMMQHQQQQPSPCSPQQQQQPQLPSAPPGNLVAPTGPCGSQVGLAPPIYAAPLPAPVVEATPPPPMLSPKFGQVGMMGRDVPPPMVSPKLPRQMLPAM